MQDWITDEFDWAVKTGLLTYKTPLIVPTSDYFPAKSGPPHQVVEGLVSNILHLVERPNDKIDLIPIDRPPLELRAPGAFQNLSEQAGGWYGDEQSSVIFYDPEMVSRPAVLIATLVHEVMHHILHQHVEFDENTAEEELATDLHVISMGFGLIYIGAAEQTGWLGYMRQSSRLYALALFMLLRGFDIEAAKNWLSRRHLHDLKQAFKTIDNLNTVKEMRETLSKKSHAE